MFSSFNDENDRRTIFEDEHVELHILAEENVDIGLLFRVNAIQQALFSINHTNIKPEITGIELHGLLRVIRAFSNNLPSAFTFTFTKR